MQDHNLLAERQNSHKPYRETVRSVPEHRPYLDRGNLPYERRQLHGHKFRIDQAPALLENSVTEHSEDNGRQLFIYPCHSDEFHSTRNK